MKRTPIHVSLGVALMFTAVALTARAGTNTDNFNVSFNYLTNGVAGSIWEGVYLGPGGFPNATGVGAAAGSVSIANANITTTSNLTFASLQTDWENAADDGVFLYK